MSDLHNMPIEPLRVILKSEWAHLKEEFKRVEQINLDQERIDAGEKTSNCRYSYSARRISSKNRNDSDGNHEAGHQNRLAALLPA